MCHCCMPSMRAAQEPCHPTCLVRAGTSAYTRHIDYKRMRAICDKVGWGGVGC